LARSQRPAWQERFSRRYQHRHSSTQHGRIYRHRVRGVGTSQLILKGDISGRFPTRGFSLSAVSNNCDGAGKPGNRNEPPSATVGRAVAVLPSDDITFRLIADYDKLDELRAA
jgi:hypothetical protein